MIEIPVSYTPVRLIYIGRKDIKNEFNLLFQFYSILLNSSGYKTFPSAKFDYNLLAHRWLFVNLTRKAKAHTKRNH